MSKQPAYCDCSIYCKYCGRHRSRDPVGHYCKTPNCQEQHGYSGCLYYVNKQRATRAKAAQARRTEEGR
jgi:hypothetical protein